MSGKECYHFTYLNRAKSIKENGLQPMLGENSKIVKDSDPKISFSDGRIGAIGMLANFYRVYWDIREDKRDKNITDEQLAQKIKQSSTFEEFGGQGIYLVFDGTNIENTGGNRGQINIYDSGTRESIPANNLNVCLIRNNITNELSYSRYEFIQYLMVNLTLDELSQMPASIQEDISKYSESHKAELDKFRNGDYNVELMSLDEFCKEYDKDIEKDIERVTLNKNKVASIAKQANVVKETENISEIMTDIHRQKEINEQKNIQSI